MFPLRALFLTFTASHRKTILFQVIRKEFLNGGRHKLVRKGKVNLEILPSIYGQLRARQAINKTHTGNGERNLEGSQNQKECPARAGDLFEHRVQ